MMRVQNHFFNVLLRSRNPVRPAFQRHRFLHSHPPPSNPRHHFPYPFALGGFASVGFVGWMYRKREQQQQHHQNQHKQTTSTPELLRVVGQVLYSIVSEETGMEDKVTYLLQELTRNPATHDAIAAQALPLLLRAATSTSTGSLVVPSKQQQQQQQQQQQHQHQHQQPPTTPPPRPPQLQQNSTKEMALQALDNLSRSQHIMATIMVQAYDTNTLVPLLQELGNRTHGTTSSAPHLGAALDQLTLAASVGVGAKTQSEIDRLTDIITETKIDSVRRFALRTLEDTLRHSTSSWSLDWPRVLSFPRDSNNPKNDVALLSLLCTATTNAHCPPVSLNMTVGQKTPLQSEHNTSFPSSSSSLADFLVGWSTDIPSTLESVLRRRLSFHKETDHDRNHERTLELRRAFSLRVLARLTSPDAADGANGLTDAHMKVLKQISTRCQQVLSKVSTLPPKSGITEQKKELQRNVVHVAQVVRNEIARGASHRGTNGTQTRARWGEIALQWLGEEPVQSCAADILVALTTRSSGGGLVPSQYVLLEQWLRVLVTVMSDEMEDTVERRVYNELKQGEHKAIKKHPKRRVSVSAPLVEGMSEVQHGTTAATAAATAATAATAAAIATTAAPRATPVEAFKELLYSTAGNDHKGNASAQSHAFKAMAIMLESPEDVLQEEPSITGKKREHMQSALQKFVLLKGWDAVEHLMEWEDTGTIDIVNAAATALDNAAAAAPSDQSMKYLHSSKLHDQVIKNCVRMVGNLLCCDLAWFNGAMLRNTLHPQRYEMWRHNLKTLTLDTQDKMNRTDLKIMHHANRALQHLCHYHSCTTPQSNVWPDGATQEDCNTLPLYADHLFPVHDENKTQQQPVADVVFVHGLSGGAFATWQSESSFQDGIDQNVKQFWPSMWFPNDFQRRARIPSRVLTFDYEARPLRPVDASTSAVPLDLEEQAEILLRKLRLAQVGKTGGPIVFVTHSLGGLVVKKMLLLATEKYHCQQNNRNNTGATRQDSKENDFGDYSDLVHNTRAVVFYSCPHKGSPLMDMLLQPKDVLERWGLVSHAHPIVKWLLSDYPPSLAMNESFGELYGDVSLSIGETKKELLEGLVDMELAGMSELLSLVWDDVGVIQIVPKRSSNPGWGAFEEIPETPHTTINKPNNMKDRRYLAMMEFVAGQCLQ